MLDFVGEGVLLVQREDPLTKFAAPFGFASWGSHRPRAASRSGLRSLKSIHRIDFWPAAMPPKPRPQKERRAACQYRSDPIHDKPQQQDQRHKHQSHGPSPRTRFCPPASGHIADDVGQDGGEVLHGCFLFPWSDPLTWHF